MNDATRKTHVAVKGRETRKANEYYAPALLWKRGWPWSSPHAIEGTVVAVNRGKGTVVLDHKDIPGLLKAMQMEFAVEDAKVLDGLKRGDLVKGRINGKSGEYVITQLAKVAGDFIAEEDLVYFCPMHPEIVRHRPGAKCPICSMPLSKRKIEWRDLRGDDNGSLSVVTEWTGRSPEEIEDQITHPLSLKLLGLPGVKLVRGSSAFDFSLIVVSLVEDMEPIDVMVARQRLLEKLTESPDLLPQGVTPKIAAESSNATVQYTMEASPESGFDASRLWRLQKYHIAPQLSSVPGVSDVTTLGPAPEYQIDVDTNKLRAHGLSCGNIAAALTQSNAIVSSAPVVKDGAEYVVRSSAGVRNTRNLEDTIIELKKSATIRLKDVATVRLGTSPRRIGLDWGNGDAVGGIVMIRAGAHERAVTRGVNGKLREVEAGLPKGVRIVRAKKAFHQSSRS